jgi:hypothetical protein
MEEAMMVSLQSDHAKRHYVTNYDSRKPTHETKLSNKKYQTAVAE